MQPILRAKVQTASKVLGNSTTRKIARAHPIKSFLRRAAIYSAVSLFLLTGPINEAVSKNQVRGKQGRVDIRNPFAEEQNASLPDNAEFLFKEGGREEKIRLLRELGELYANNELYRKTHSEKRYKDLCSLSSQFIRKWKVTFHDRPLQEFSLDFGKWLCESAKYVNEYTENPELFGQTHSERLTDGAKNLEGFLESPSSYVLTQKGKNFFGLLEITPTDEVKAIKKRAYEERNRHKEEARKEAEELARKAQSNDRSFRESIKKAYAEEGIIGLLKLDGKLLGGMVIGTLFIAGCAALFPGPPAGFLVATWGVPIVFALWVVAQIPLIIIALSSV